MAIHLLFIDLVIPISTIERVWASDGGFQQFLATRGILLGETVWHDNHLCVADSVMNGMDAEDMIADWEELGLQGLVGVAPNQWWKDFAICTSPHGPTQPCNWLEFDPAGCTVYLKGTPKGDVVRSKFA